MGLGLFGPDLPSRSQYNALVDRKYDIQQQNANTGTTSAKAQQLTANTNAEYNPARIGLALAETDNAIARTGEVAPDAAAARNLLGAQTVESGSRTAGNKDALNPLGPNAVRALANSYGLISGGTFVPQATGSRRDDVSTSNPVRKGLGLLEQIQQNRLYGGGL